MKMQCKNCKNGKHHKHTDTVQCNVLCKELFFNRADSCEHYEDNAVVKNLKAKGKYRGD
jgi:hypothetical protein